MKTFVDTSFVVGLGNRCDQYHEKSNILSAQYLGSPLITTDTVLLEIGNTLSTRLRPYAIQIITEFLESDDIEIVGLDEELFGRAFDLYKTYSDKSWGLVDCVSFTVMRERDVTECTDLRQTFYPSRFSGIDA